MEEILDCDIEVLGEKYLRRGSSIMKFSCYQGNLELSLVCGFI